MSTASIHSPLIKRARQEVVFLSSSLFDRCIGATIEALEDAERKSRAIGVRMELGEAWAALSKHRAELRGAFPARLDTAMALALDTARHAAVAPTRQILSEDDLALVEDAEVSRFVEASRLQQTVMPVVEESLALLDSLMSSALGLPVVRADLNPLRPDVACGAVMELLETLPEPPEVRAHWVRHMARPLAQELKKLYESVNKLLAEQGVEEARVGHGHAQQRRLQGDKGFAHRRQHALVVGHLLHQRAHGIQPQRLPDVRGLRLQPH